MSTAEIIIVPDRVPVDLDRFPLWRGTPGEIALVRQDLELTEQFHERREFRAVMPPIIGVVPESERAFFSDVVPLGIVKTLDLKNPKEDDSTLVKALRKNLPLTMGILERDAAQFDDPRMVLDRVRIERSSAAAGEVLGVSHYPHCDPVGWVVSNAEGAGTVFCGGWVTTEGRGRGFSHVDHTKQDYPRLVRRKAPPFAIIRMGSSTVHISPTVTQNTERTLMTFETPLWRR